MINDHTLLRLLDRLYSAAERPDQWGAFLDDLSEMLASKMTVLMHQDMRTGTFAASVSAATRIDPDTVRAYEAYYASKNVFFQCGPKVKTGDVVGDHLISVDTLLRSEYYNDFLAPNDARWAAGVSAFNDEGVLSLISTMRGHRDEPFGEREFELLRVLTPHVQRALQIHRRLFVAEERATFASDTLDILPHGVIVLNERGEVIEMNRAAREMAAARDGFALSGRQLTIHAVAAGVLLRHLVADALRTCSGSSFGAGGVLLVPRPSLRKEYQFVVAPLRSSIEGRPRPGVAILIADLDRSSDLTEKDLQSLYRLTPAEARVAHEIAAGADRKECAKNLSISVETVRSHLKRIFEKTGTSTQRELVALLARSSATRTHA